MRGLRCWPIGAPACTERQCAHAALPPRVLHRMQSSTSAISYYSGDDHEVQKRFLAFWPEVPGARNLALNGNHEMYTGGNAYFDDLLGDSRFAQSSSCFALRNNDWLLVGLDTAFDEHDLHGGQAAWLQQLADAHPGHRLMLFSHHQPFSAFEARGQTGTKARAAARRGSRCGLVLGPRTQVCALRPASKLAHAWPLRRPQRLSVLPISCQRPARPAGLGTL